MLALWLCKALALGAPINSLNKNNTVAVLFR